MACFRCVLAWLAPIVLFIRALGESHGSAGTVPQFLRSYGYAPVELTLTSGNSHIHEGNHSLETRFIAQGSMGGRSMGMFIDTGASFTLFDEDQIAPVGLKIHSLHSTIGGAKGTSRSLSWAALPAFQIGSHRVEKFEVGITSLKGFNKPRLDAGASPLLGILGMDYLLREGALIDFQGGTIYFQRTGVARQ